MDWYDGPANMTISEAFRCATPMPPRPEKPAWDNTTPSYTNSELGGIYVVDTLADRIMHTHTMSGHCFVWNWPNQKYGDGFRLFSYRGLDGWANVSILAHELDTLIGGTGGRMYCGNWRKMAEERSVRRLHDEGVVLLDYDKRYVYGDDTPQAVVDACKEDVMRWWLGLPEVELPPPTEEELSRKIEYR